jgi:hypothetical protein
MCTVFVSKYFDFNETLFLEPVPFKNSVFLNGTSTVSCVLMAVKHVHFNNFAFFNDMIFQLFTSILFFFLLLLFFCQHCYVLSRTCFVHNRDTNE